VQIQKAVKACQQSRYFARPLAWRGSGLAVDLARRLSPEKVLQVAAFNETAAHGMEWAPTPEDLLDDWEMVDLATLAREGKT